MPMSPRTQEAVGMIHPHHLLASAATTSLNTAHYHHHQQHLHTLNQQPDLSTGSSNSNINTSYAVSVITRLVTSTSNTASMSGGGPAGTMLPTQQQQQQCAPPGGSSCYSNFVHYQPQHQHESHHHHHHQSLHPGLLSPNASRSSTPSSLSSSPNPSPPSIPGSPLHQVSVEGAAAGLSQLQLQQPSPAPSPLPLRSPHHSPRHSVPPARPLSPIAHYQHNPLAPQLSGTSSSSSPSPAHPCFGSSPGLNATRSGPSPPPLLALGCIREEPSKSREAALLHIPSTSSSSAVAHSFKKNPQISVTDETGDQFLITSAESSPDDGLDAMETSTYSSPLSPEGGGLPSMSQQLSPHIHLAASLSSPLPSSSSQTRSGSNEGGILPTSFQHFGLSKSASLSSYPYPSLQLSPRHLASSNKFVKGFSLDNPLPCDPEGPSITRGTVGLANARKLLHHHPHHHIPLFSHYQSLQDNNNTTTLSQAHSPRSASRNERNLVRQNAVIEPSSNIPASTANPLGLSRHQLFITNTDFRHSFPPLMPSCALGEENEFKMEEEQQQHQYQLQLGGCDSANLTTTSTVVEERSTGSTSSERPSQNLQCSSEVEDRLWNATGRTNPATTNTAYDAETGANRCIHKTESGSFVLTLPHKWYGLPVSELLEVMVQAVDANAPYLVSEGVSEKGLSVRDEAGVRVDLEVTPDLHNLPQTLKLRRLSGNELQYTQLCQHLINCMTS